MAQIQISILKLTNHVTLGRIFNFSMPQLLYLENEVHNSVFLIGLMLISEVEKLKTFPGTQ